MPFAKPAAILKLIRVANLPTALADVLTGYLLVVQGAGLTWLLAKEGAVAALGFALLGSALLYSGGMANNDVQHAHKDTILRKRRPIVEEAISYAAARFLANVLLLAGVLLVTLVPVWASPHQRLIGSAMGGVALLLTLLIVWYNRLSAGRSVDWSYVEPSRATTLLACVVMALCRVLNLGIGLFTGIALIGQFRLLPPPTLELWLALGLSFLWFLQLTLVSTLEDAAHDSRKLRPLGLTFLGLGAALCLLHPALGRVVMGGIADQDLLPLLLSVGFLILALVVPAHRYVAALKQASPRNVGMVIKWSIISAPWLWASLVISQQASDWPAGLVIGLLPLVSMALGRVSHST